MFKFKRILKEIRKECEKFSEELKLNNQDNAHIPLNQKMQLSDYFVHISGRIKFWKRKK